jgi:holliday junction DNA helicase RuvA
MIASVAGTVATRCPGHVVVESGGLGYRLNVSAQTLRDVPPPGEQVRLLSHLLLKDDGMHLYGFGGEQERELFLKLISVAGVGPKMALAVLSGSSAGELARAIANGDGKRFQVVPGVGKKTAERIIVELREKLADELGAELVATNGSAHPRALAREGLIGLGYDLPEAEKMLDAALDDTAAQEPEELIAAALRVAARGEAA